MSRRAFRRRKWSDLTARDIDEMRVTHDQVELDRYLAEQEKREPRDDPPARRDLPPIHDEDFRA